MVGDELLSLEHQVGLGRRGVALEPFGDRSVFIRVAIGADNRVHHHIARYRTARDYESKGLVVGTSVQMMQTHRLTICTSPGKENPYPQGAPSFPAF